MANAYFNHMAVSSAQEASILANEYTWIILQVLHASGSRGLTPKEVHELVEKEEGVGVSSSKIYGILKRLYELEWIHRHYDKEAQAQRNTLSVVWGDVELDQHFADAVRYNLKRYIKKELYPVLIGYFQKALSTLSEDPKNKKWLPENGSSSFCKKCKLSHEADEFFHGLIQEAILELYDSEEFTKFLKTNSFADQDYEAEPE